jgi:hypothetical protein
MAQAQPPERSQLPASLVSVEQVHDIMLTVRFNVEGFFSFACRDIPFFSITKLIRCTPKLSCRARTRGHCHCFVYASHCTPPFLLRFAHYLQPCPESVLLGLSCRMLSSAFANTGSQRSEGSRNAVNVSGRGYVPELFVGSLMHVFG